MLELKENDRYILNAGMLASKIIVAWGEFGKHLPNRVDHVLEILNWKPVYCLGKNKSGQPRHPLYVKTIPEHDLQVYRPSVLKLNDSHDIFTGCEARDNTHSFGGERICVGEC